MKTLEEIKQQLLENGYSKVIIKKDKYYGRTLWGYKQSTNYHIIHYVDRHGEKQIYKRKDRGSAEVVLNEEDVQDFNSRWYI